MIEAVLAVAAALDVARAVRDRLAELEDQA